MLPGSNPEDNSESANEERLPIDLDAVALGLQAEDSVGQDALYRALLQALDVPSQERDDYQTKPVQKIPLSRYKILYEENNARRAISLLKERCRVEIDQEFKLDVDDLNLFFQCSKHFLDYRFVSSDQLGLWAAIPIDTFHDHSFFVEINLQQEFRGYKCRYAKLNYDPTGRLLYSGKVHDEDLYIAMCPRKVAEGAVEDIQPGHCTGDTRMATKHSRMVIIFMATALARLPGRAYHCFNPYNINIEGEDSGIRLETNIL